MSYNHRFLVTSSNSAFLVSLMQQKKLCEYVIAKDGI